MRHTALQRMRVQTRRYERTPVTSADPCLVSDAELAKRRQLNRPFAAMPERGYARLYMESVLQAEAGI
jgi:hypothetical protein